MKKLKRLGRRCLCLLMAAAFCAALLPAVTAPAEAAGAEALRAIPYFGDRSKCRLTAGQAEAFADAIEAAAKENRDKTASYYFDEDSGMATYGTLVDTGNGVPVMLSTGLVWHYNPMHYGVGDGFSYGDYDYSAQSGSAWEWNGSAVVKAVSGDAFMGMTADGAVFLNGMFGGGVEWNLCYSVHQLADGTIDRAASHALVDVVFTQWDFEQLGINFAGRPLKNAVQDYVDARVASGDWPRMSLDWDTYSAEGDLTQEYGFAIVKVSSRGDSGYFERPNYTMERSSIVDGSGTWREANEMASALRTYALTLRLQGAAAEEILAAIPYYGDSARCRMTGEQAEAFAGTLADMNIEGPVFGNPDNIIYNIHAVLCDVENNGNPVLVVHYNISTPVGDWAGEHVESLYVWSDNQVKEIGSFRSSTYGTAASENFVSFGKNASGCYSWSEWRREMAGAVQYETVSVVENGVLRSTTYETDYDWENDTTALYINGVFERITAGEPDIRDLLAQNGAPQFDVEDHWIDCSIGLPRAAMIAALRAYAEAAAVPAYGFPEAGGSDVHYQDVVQAASGRGAVQAVYRLLDDLYYVLLEDQGTYAGAVIRGVTRDGRPAWEVFRADGEPAGEADLEDLVYRLLSAANLSPDFSRLRGAPTAEDLTACLRELLENYDGLSPNDAARTGLAIFLDSAVSVAASGAVSGRDNRLTLDSALVSGPAGTAGSAWADLRSVLDSAGVTLNRTVVPRVRLLWQDLDPEQECQITVDGSLVSGLNSADLQLLLGSRNRYIRFSCDSLRRLTDDLETFSIQFSHTGGNTYSISFLDKDGQPLDSLPSPITLGLPASGMTSTVMASYAGGRDNWGGQYDEASGILAFETRYSGQYEVRENQVPIGDVTDLSEESRAAVRFLASKGYLSLDGDGLFNPQLPMTRYDCTRSLVGMLFALDRSLPASFTDVPKDSEYYAYVASAEANRLVPGITETGFAGEQTMSVEQMLALAGRTLAERKGYTLPENADRYLSGFEDGGAVGDEARPYAALSVREGLWDRGGMLNPQNEITRGQAALVLYRLFLRMYEAPPVALELPLEGAAEQPDSDNGPNMIAAAAAAAAVAVSGAAAAVVIGKKRKTAAEK